MYLYVMGKGLRRVAIASIYYRTIIHYNNNHHYHHHYNEYNFLVKNTVIGK